MSSVSARGSGDHQLIWCIEAETCEITFTPNGFPLGLIGGVHHQRSIIGHTPPFGLAMIIHHQPWINSYNGSPLPRNEITAAE